MTRQSYKFYHIILVLLFAAALLALIPATEARAEKPWTVCDVSEIHPIWWKARMRYDVKTKVKETGKTRVLKQGQNVTVTTFSIKSNYVVMTTDGYHSSVSRGSVFIYDDACTPGDFRASVKEEFVNSRTLTSKTKYLIWVSTDRQSLNVFTGSNKNWKLVHFYRCSTGMPYWSTPLGRRKIIGKFMSYYSEEFDSHLPYFLSFGGSGIHRWPGGKSGSYLGVAPCSHGCIRLGSDGAKWCFKHIPVGTTLYVY